MQRNWGRCFLVLIPSLVDFNKQLSKQTFLYKSNSCTVSCANSIFINLKSAFTKNRKGAVYAKKSKSKE